MFTWTLLPAYLRPQWVLPTLLNSRSTLCPTGAFCFTPQKCRIPQISLCSSLEALNGFMFGVDATKSLILTLACIERVITVDEAVKKKVGEGEGCWNKNFRWNWPGSSCCSRQITGEVWSGLTTSRSSTRPLDWLRQPSLFNSRPLKQRREISNLKCDTS